MARYTIKNLRELVAEANERHPRETPNFYGNLNRFLVDSAYGLQRVCEYVGDSSAIHAVTNFGSSREAAEEFRRYLWENY